MIQIIKDDLFRYTGQKYNLKSLIRGMRSQGFRFMFFKRLKDNASKNSILWLLYKVLTRRYVYKYGFQIGGNIGGGFFIGHFGTIVINENVIIGKNCNIAHNVTIGVTRRGEKKGVPVIGNRVWIGAGAVIVGAIKIGDNVLIAPNAYVNFDIPDNSIVIGNPGIIKKSDSATIGYINNLI